jgi:uncharacterized protein YdaU (DUF1376 family)
MTPTTPAPMVPAEVDCTDLDGFMLNVEKLMASELVALSSHEVIGAALLLWCRAWKQRPAASLPNDDKVNAAFARMPLARFRKMRDEVLRGFVLCSDGRLYHRTLAEEAATAYARKLAFQRKREADAERLRKWRSGNTGETAGETPNETPRETRFVAEGQDRTVKKYNPPTPQGGRDGVRKFPPGFDDFWAAYPRKVGKDAAARAFAKRRIGSELLAALLGAVDAQKRWPAWAKDDGRFIPHPATWLNEGRWQDEPPQGAPGDDLAALFRRGEA